MIREHAHTAAVALVIAAGAAVVFGPPSAPIWVRWVGLIMFVPAVLLFIATAPRSRT